MYGSGRLEFVLIMVLFFAAVTAFNSWRGLQFETYNKKSYTTNLRGLVISLTIFLMALLSIISFQTWLQGAMDSD